MYKSGPSRRKGITPIIAVVLLLMMTIAAGGMASIIITQTIDTYGGGAKVAVEAELRDRQSGLSIVSVYNQTSTTVPGCASSPGCMTLSIKNTKTFAYSATEFLQSSVIINGRPLIGYKFNIAPPDPASDGLTPNEVTNQVIPRPWPTVIGDSTNIVVDAPFGQDAVYQCVIRTAGADFC